MTDDDKFKDAAVKAEFGRRFRAAVYSKVGKNQSAAALWFNSHLPEHERGAKQGRSLSRDDVSHYINGVSIPRGERLAFIEKTLGVKPGSLVPQKTKMFPALAMRPIDEHRVYLSINREMPLVLATKIVGLISAAEHKGGKR